MSTYSKFSDILRNHESCGTTPSKPARAPKAIKPDLDAEPTLDDLGALGGVLRRIQDSPSASVAAKADETVIAGEEVCQDVSGDFESGAAAHLNHLNQLNLRQSRSDAEEERAETAKHGADTPLNWAEGFIRLNPHCAPADVPPKCWRTFVDDLARFLDGGWAEKAAALGWGARELFGADSNRPFARLDQQGLCWLIKGGRLVGLASDAAVIETCSGARHTYRRKPTEAGRVLPWGLGSATPQVSSHYRPVWPAGRKVKVAEVLVATEIGLPSDLPDDFGKNGGT